MNLIKIALFTFSGYLRAAIWYNLGVGPFRRKSNANLQKSCKTTQNLLIQILMEFSILYKAII